MGSVIAIDLGASNGRLILTHFKQGRIETKELQRFLNLPIKKANHLFWDISSIIKEIKIGLKKYVNKYGPLIDGIGIDTWGVDFGLLSDNGTLLENPYSYQDTHTVNVMETIHQRMTMKELFRRTGVESAPINTIYQLYSILKERPDLIKKTHSIVTLPSLIIYLLTGQKSNEFTHASTTQLLNHETKEWDSAIMETVFLRQLPFAKFLPTNEIIAYTTAEFNRETGLKRTSLINVPGHDTASAFTAMPLSSKQTIFMSCGTWVLMGIEVEKPITTDKAYKWGFTNEGTALKT